MEFQIMGLLDSAWRRTFGGSGLRRTKYDGIQGSGSVRVGSF